MNRLLLYVTFVLLVLYFKKKLHFFLARMLTLVGEGRLLHSSGSHILPSFILRFFLPDATSSLLHARSQELGTPRGGACADSGTPRTAEQLSAC